MCPPIRTACHSHLVSFSSNPPVEPYIALQDSISHLGRQVSDQVLGYREVALPSEEETDMDRVNQKLAPRSEGPFPVLQVDDHAVTILRGTGMKERLSCDRVVKSPPWRSSVEVPQPREAAWEEEPNKSTNAAASPDDTPAARTYAASRLPGLKEAVTSGGAEHVIFRLA